MSTVLMMVRRENAGVPRLAVSDNEEPYAAVLFTFWFCFWFCACLFLRFETV